MGNNLSILYEREHQNPRRHYWCLSLIPLRSSSYNVFQYSIMQDINKTSVCSITKYVTTEKLKESSLHLQVLLIYNYIIRLDNGD